MEYNIFDSETNKTTILRSDKELIEFANKEQDFYDCHNYILNTAKQCKHYIETSCDNLTISIGVYDCPLCDCALTELIEDSECIRACDACGAEWEQDSGTITLNPNEL